MSDRRPAQWDIRSVAGEPLSLTLTFVDDNDDPIAGISACVVGITSLDGSTLLEIATTAEQSTGVWSANWSDSQITDVGHGTWRWFATITIDGSEQTALAGTLQLARPALAGVA